MIPQDVFTNEEIEVIKRGLRLSSDSSVFPDWELSILFGLELSEVKEVYSAWPDVGLEDEIVLQAVHSSLGNLLGYPHGCDNMVFDVLKVGRGELNNLLRKLIAFEKRFSEGT